MPISDDLVNQAMTGMAGTSQPKANDVQTKELNGPGGTGGGVTAPAGTTTGATATTNASGFTTDEQAWIDSLPNEQPTPASECQNTCQQAAEQKEKDCAEVRRRLELRLEELKCYSTIAPKTDENGSSTGGGCGGTGTTAQPQQTQASGGCNQCGAAAPATSGCGTASCPYR